MTSKIYKGYRIMKIDDWKASAQEIQGNDWMMTQVLAHYRHLLRTGRSWVATAEQSIVCTYYSGTSLDQVQEKIDTEA